MDQGQVSLSHRADLRRTGAGNVLLDLLHRAHAAEDDRDLWLAPHPLQRPVGRGSPMGSDVPNLLNSLRWVDESSTQQRSHDHHRQSLGTSILQSLGPCLHLNAHVVILDLAQRPSVISIDDFLEHQILIVKRESYVANAPIGDGLLGRSEQVQLPTFLPPLLVQAVEKIEVDVIHLQLPQLLVEVLVEILGNFDQPDGQLRRQPDFLSIPSFQSTTQE